MKRKWIQLVGFCMWSLCTAVSAQDGTALSGRVTDENGRPLVAANVMIRSLRLGTVTDIDGGYRFTVPGSAAAGTVELEASYIGYKKSTAGIDLGETRSIVHNFRLAADVLKMDEVVVTGFGVGVEKEKLGVTIAKVGGSDVVNSDEGNVVSALHGKVANVEVTSQSGEPGAASYIRIRGANSITGGTQPLFVVDGSPVNNESVFSDNRQGHDGVSESNRASDLNPEDIESIEILKGPAASAIYGSRAANGVVMVQTKKGKAGRARLSYKMSYSWDQVNRTQPLQSAWGQGVDGLADPTSPWSWGPKLDGGVPVYDHETDLFETGHVFENNVSVSGGNERTAYYLSLGRYDHDGFIKGNSGYRRYAARLNASQFINDRLRLSGNFSFSDTDADRIQRGSNVSGLLLGAWRTPPDFDNRVYLSPEGYHRSYRLQDPDAENGSRGYDNPFFIVNRQINASKVGRAFGNIKIDYDPVRWVHLNYTLGNDFSSDERRTLFPKGSSSYPEGRIAREIFNIQETDGHFTAEATRSFTPADMRLNVLLGHQWNQRRYEQFSVFGEQIGASGFDQLDNVSTSLPNEYQELVRDESFFGVTSIDLFNQLYLSGGLRNDGSSTFGRSKKRHWYPKGSAAWEFTNLNLFKKPGSRLDFGKIRFAYGEAGQQPDPYLTITAYSTDIYTDSWITPSGGLTPFAYGFPGFHSTFLRGNDEILPQRSKEWETGFDLGFFGGRLGMGATVYNNRTEDVIYQFPVATSTGYIQQLKNGGLISNKGLELNLDVRPVSTPNFQWDLGLVWAKNKNRVERLDGADFIFIQGFETSCYAQEGYAMSIFRGADFVRFGRGCTVQDASGGAVSIDEAYTGWKNGDLYVAEDGFPLMDPEDRVIGDPNPDWTGSIRNSVRLFNKVTVSALIDIKRGGDVYNGTKGALVFFGTHESTDIENTDLQGNPARGKQHVFEGAGPGAGRTVFLDQNTWYAFGLGNSFNGPDAQFVEDGSYVKLRELAVSFNLRHPSVTKWTGLSDIDIRLSGRNLITWTKYTGIDPETNISGNENWRGLDYFNNPQTRSYMCTLRLNY